jgi:hypothetical protein
MIRPAFAALAFVALLPMTATSTHAQTIYRWRDATGGWHFSNQTERTPADATVVELPPIGSIEVPEAASRKRTRRSGLRRDDGVPPAAPCGPADPTGLAIAVGTTVRATTPHAPLTLLVGGVPLFTSPDADVDLLLTPWDPDAPHASLSQSAVAYPGGTSCPDTPPLVRYPTSGSREFRSRGLCDDYRRAFAQVGVAANRDAGIGRSFREIARAFVEVRARGNVAVASGFQTAVADGMFTSDALRLAPHMTVPLDPWIVAAHVSQTDDLASDSDALVEQLTVALEEIDRAARASGCWD